MTEIIQMKGSLANKIEKAKRIKAEMQEKIPEMLELRQQLIDAGMCKDDLSSIASVVTDTIDYSALRDDPQRYNKRYRIHPITSKEIDHAVQARKERPFSASDLVRQNRERSRGRKAGVAR